MGKIKVPCLGQKHDDSIVIVIDSERQLSVKTFSVKKCFEKITVKKIWKHVAEIYDNWKSFNYSKYLPRGGQ